MKKLKTFVIIILLSTFFLAATSFAATTSTIFITYNEPIGPNQWTNISGQITASILQNVDYAMLRIRLYSNTAAENRWWNGSAWVNTETSVQINNFDVNLLPPLYVENSHNWEYNGLSSINFIHGKTYLIDIFPYYYSGGNPFHVPNAHAVSAFIWDSEAPEGTCSFQNESWG